MTTALPPLPIPPVVVGYDDSAPAACAIDAAADEAARRGAPLIVVVVGASARLWSDGPEKYFRDFPLAEQSSTIASARALGRVTARRPGLPVELMVVSDPAADRLLRLGRRAQLLVLGSRGQNRIRCLAIGSTSAEIARVFTCPVLIAREHAEVGVGSDRPRGRSEAESSETGRVVVGLDGTERSEAVMTVALSQALLQGRPLVAVHAFTGMLGPANHAVDRAWAAFVRAVAAFGCESGRSHEFVLCQQDPVSALLDRVAPGDLLVLGTRGRGRLAGLVPTAVSRAILDAMPCDLLVVRSGGTVPQLAAPPSMSASSGRVRG